MQNGLLVYTEKYNIFNIGDYIQSLAAKQFFHKIDVLIDRENLDKYTGEKVKIILNGWFMHSPENWPPSQFINPLFVSFHINSAVEKVLTNEVNIAYLKKHSPIGCRDNNTVTILREKNVEAYFSGCLTLTLAGKYKKNKQSDIIYFVDPYFDYYDDAYHSLCYIKLLLTHYNLINKITLSLYSVINIKTLKKGAAFYKSYKDLFSDEVIRDAVYISHIYSNTYIIGHTAKFKLADSLLKKYASAKFVVTSRIHCALPCLAIGTPVLYVENVNQKKSSFCRLSGLTELLHVIKYNKEKLSCELIKKNKITQSFVFNNKLTHTLFVEKLVKTCEIFSSNT